MQRDLRVLLVDDEPLPRLGMRQGLAGVPGIEIVGEASDGIGAVEAIETLRPDLVLLDVQMPGLDGFGVLAAVATEIRPAVVFVTAFEQFALRAFEAHAVDYLLKPFDDERLRSAVERAGTWLTARNTARPALDALLGDVDRRRGRDRFMVRHAGRLRLVSVEEITWVEARGNYVHLHTADGPFLLRETLTAMVAVLPADRFVRVHRSAIVALAAVDDVRRVPSGDHELRLRDGSLVPMSRTHKAGFLARWPLGDR